MREIWTNVLHTSAARLFSLATGMLVLFTTARLLGPEGRGQLAAAMAWVAVFATCAHLSLDQVALHRLVGDPHRKRVNVLFGTLLAFAGGVTLLAWTAAAIVHAHAPDVFKGVDALVLLVAFAALPFMVWEHYGSYLLTGLDHVRIYNRFQVVGSTVSLCAVLLMVAALHWGVPGAALATTAGSAVVALGGISFLARTARTSGPIKPSLAEARVLLAGSARLHLNAVGTVLVGYGNVLILSHFRGAEEVGWFQLANQLLAVLMILPQASTMVVFGEVARVGPDAAWPANKQLLRQLLAAIVVLDVVAALLAPWIIPLLAGPRFLPAAQPFQYMLVGLLGTTISAVMAPQWIGRGYFWQASAITIAACALNLMAGMWVVPVYGMRGAVAVFLGTSLLQVLTNLGLAWMCEMRHRKNLPPIAVVTGG